MDEIVLNSVSKEKATKDTGRWNALEKGEPDVTSMRSLEMSTTRGYLTKEELEAILIEEPKWRRIRIGFLVAFFVIWFGLVTAAVLTVVFSEKCPPRPNLEFWQSKVAYQLNPFAFKDSNDDWIGDIKGLISEQPYVKDTLRAGFVILTSIFKGQYTSAQQSLGHVEDYKLIDPALGTKEDFAKLIKQFHRAGLEVVLSIDFNAVSENHVWASNNSLLTPYDANKRWVSRNGQEPFLSKNGGQFYSVDNKLYDLDFTKPEVMTKIKDVLDYWLKENVDGFLLTNCAFYVESDEASGAGSTGNASWFARYPTAQLFTNESIKVVQEIRQHIDAFSKASAKKKLLMVDAGDIGYGLEDTLDKSAAFLGTDEAPGAHLIIHRQFVKNRGWKNVDPNAANVPPKASASISKYDANSGMNKTAFALLTASETDLPHADILHTAATFLLPGTPVIYYGSELGINAIVSSTPPGFVYPMNKVPNPQTPLEESTLTAQLPMPWDQTGQRFNEQANTSSTFQAYLQRYEISETIESVSATGRGPTTFTLIQKLVELRTSPSLLWGALKLLNLDPAVTSRRLEAFAREAEGYPSFTVVFDDPNLNSTDTRNGQVINLSEVCESATVRLVYPESRLEVGTEVDMKSIYLTMNDSPSVHVFECNAT